VRVGAIKLVVLERLVGEVGGYGTPDDAEDDPDDAPGPIVRDEEARARCMPDEAVAREVSRPLLDNTAGTTTWFDAGEPGCGGEPDTEEVSGSAITLGSLTALSRTDRTVPDYSVYAGHPAGR
jgi:hypothetical protein